MQYLVYVLYKEEI